jgi:hypothetical protein
MIDLAIDLACGNGFYLSRPHFVTTPNRLLRPFTIKICVLETGDEMFGEENPVFGRKFLDRLREYS